MKFGDLNFQEAHTEVYSIPSCFVEQKLHQ